MFETIFTAKAAQKHRLAPLVREREQFLKYLQDRGTGRSCLHVYAPRLNQIVRFLKLKRMRPVRLLEIRVAARRWANYRGEHRHLLPGPWSEPKQYHPPIPACQPWPIAETVLRCKTQQKVVPAQVFRVHPWKSSDSHLRFLPDLAPNYLKQGRKLAIQSLEGAYKLL
jgi:hypothetical protein